MLSPQQVRDLGFRLRGYGCVVYFFMATAGLMADSIVTLEAVCIQICFVVLNPWIKW